MSEEPAPWAQLTPGAPAWQRRLAGRLLAGYRDPGLVYDQLLREALVGAKVWIDAGCGDNLDILSEKGFAGLALGFDLQEQKIPKYLRADAREIPLGSGGVDLITCRWVFEHLADPEAVLAEMSRTLKPGGRVLIRTTNRRHYLSWMGRWLPLKLKSALAGKQVFPTRFRFNDPGDIRQYLARSRNWRLEKMELIENLHHGNPVLFVASVLGLRLADGLGLKDFRSTIILSMVKVGP